MLLPAIGGGSGKIEYSTTEKEIGTWINGEKLYQRVIIKNNPTNGWSTLQTYSSDWVNTLKIVEVSARFSMGTWESNPMESSEDYIRITCQNKGFRSSWSAGVGTVSSITFISSIGICLPYISEISFSQLTPSTTTL